MEAVENAKRVEDRWWAANNRWRGLGIINLRREVQRAKRLDFGVVTMHDLIDYSVDVGRRTVYSSEEGSEAVRRSQKRC